MDIAVLPHFDPAGRVLEWRNHFDFDPLEECERGSYASTVIDLCLHAIEVGATPETTIDFSLAGEMGRSLFKYPSSYGRLLDQMTARLADRTVRFGVSLNHNDIAGGHEPTDAERAGLQALVDKLDFVGFSNYRPFERPPRAEQFAEDCGAFLAALRRHGIHCPDDTPLHFSEIGLGGAPAANGSVDATRAAAMPWEGTARGANPWRSNPMRDLRRKYFDAALEFLRTQPGARRVEAAYLWTEGSWDPLGIDRQKYRDVEILRRVRKHNTDSQVVSR